MTVHTVEPGTVTSTVTKPMTALEMTNEIIALRAKVAELEKALEPKRNEATREMTDEDARKILTGELATLKHKDAAARLGLSYGQIYSCRLEFTFKHIHKEMKDAKIANPWVK